MNMIELLNVVLLLLITFLETIKIGPNSLFDLARGSHQGFFLNLGASMVSSRARRQKSAYYDFQFQTVTFCG